MPKDRHTRFLLGLLYAGLGMGALWLCMRFLLPWLAPFLIALALAALLEPGVRLLSQRLHLPRWGASALCAGLLSLLLLAGLGLLLWRLGYEAALLLGRLPTLLSGLPTLTRRLEGWLYRFQIALPVPFQEYAQQLMERLLEQGIALPNRLYDTLSGAVSSALAALPAAGLFLFTTLLATYFISAGRPELCAALKRSIPERWREPAARGATSLKQALGGWLKAQGLLMLITFGELALGLLLLRVDLALVLSALIALVDALPVLGTGTVLVPWALVSLLGGNWKLALGLAVLYGVIWLVRSLLEPRLIGSRVGLPPLAALLSLYVGFQAFGVAGMIQAPLLAVLVRQLWSALRPHAARPPA